MSNFPAYLEPEVKHCRNKGCGKRWLGNKECPECAGKKTGKVHYEAYKVNLRTYKRRYGKNAEPGN